MSLSDPSLLARLRIGHGFDVHRFGEGDHLMLGGVRVDFDYGFVAHSDGDVVLHALSDALLGAAALGDIGQHFPDTDEQWRGADSRALLRHVVALVNRKGFGLINVDVTILAQAPKMAPHIGAMREVIANDIALEMSSVNVKATTTEKLGFTGRGEGIAVEAVALLMRHDEAS
jgi:2-C-methyl-D-erythritol 2,4-cyclodiphosphate synthase